MMSHDVRTNNVVDIMPHPGTSAQTVELVKVFAERIGQIAIVLHKEHPGYVFNNMLSTWFSTALNLAANGVASPEDIDRAWMGVMRVHVGPFGVMDQVGLKTVWTILDFWAKELNDQQATANANFVKQYVDKGHLRKDKTGFLLLPQSCLYTC
jgi:3-hydroxybutyryl-CoA dehydrogenase